MFVAPKDPTPLGQPLHVAPQPVEVKISNPDQWERLLTALKNMPTKVIGPGAIHFGCPCCHMGVGLAGNVVDPFTNEESLVAHCSTCGAGFDQVIAHEQRRPVPQSTQDLMRGGFIGPRVAAPVEVAPPPLNEPPKRPWWRR